MMFNPHNTLDIPTLAGPFATACTGIASALIPFLFVTQILSEQTKTIKNEKPDYFKVMFNTVIIIFALIFLYKWLFLKIVAICEIIGMTLYNAGDWGDFVQEIAENQTTQLSVINLNVTAFLSAFFSNIITFIAAIFFTIRYILLAVLYSIGPLAFVCGLSPLTRTFLKSWFTAVFQVSFWVILFNVMQAVLIAVNLHSANYGDSVAGPIVNGFVITLFALAIPSITSSLFSSGNMGSIGVATYGAIAAVGTKYGRAASGTLLERGSKYGKNAVQNVVGKYKQRSEEKERKKRNPYL